MSTKSVYFSWGEIKMTKKRIQGRPATVVSGVDTSGWWCEIYRGYHTTSKDERVGHSFGHESRLSAIRAAHRNIEWDRPGKCKCDTPSGKEGGLCRKCEKLI